MKTQFRAAAAVGLVAAVAACSASDTSVWAAPGDPTRTPLEALCDVDPTVAATAREALVVTGVLAPQPARVSSDTFWGIDRTDDESVVMLDPVDIEVWTVSTVQVVSGGSVNATTILVANTPWLVETDVAGVPVDIGRLRPGRVVFLLDPAALESASHGEVYSLADSCQVGASFFGVAANGRIVQDPWARIPMGAPDAAGEATVAEQLGIAD